MLALFGGGGPTSGVRDGSREIMRELSAQEPQVRPILRKPPNGVGRTISEGLAAATGRYVMSMDWDFLHILPELRDMFDAAAGGADVVLGSRFSRSSVLINYPIQKIVCNRSFHFMLGLVSRRKTWDVTNNLKLLHREVVENLDVESDWFVANAETGLKLILMGYDVHPVAISWINCTPRWGRRPSRSSRTVSVTRRFWGAWRGDPASALGSFQDGRSAAPLLSQRPEVWRTLFSGWTGTIIPQRKVPLDESHRDGKHRVLRFRPGR